MTGKGKKNVSKKILLEIVNRIVKVAAPEKIILFGSAARGTMGPGSDLDILVIKAGSYHSRDIATQIYMSLYGIGHAIDILVVTQEGRKIPELTLYCDWTCHAGGYGDL
jgi:predicted nucleotidyltransferase